MEKLEFTQGLLNFANKIEKKFLIDGLLPSLQILVNIGLIYILELRKSRDQKGPFGSVYSTDYIYQGVVRSRRI